MTKVAVVGAAGYSGIELVRWVLGHPTFELACVTSGRDAGRTVGELYPELAPHTAISFTQPDARAIADCADLAFLAVPHTGALGLAPSLLDAGVTVVDLSADFRLNDPLVYAHWYGAEHTAEALLEEAVFGLPEMDRSRLAGARLVACPGCYPTATVLACMPAFEAGVATGPRVIVDAKSGVSGAGRSATETTHYCSADEAVTPYKVISHRHIPEMGQALSEIAGTTLSVVFTPHLVPMMRGLLSTAYLDVPRGTSTESVHELYARRYEAEPFVSVHPLGSMPSTSEVVGTNRAHLGLAVDEDAGVLVVACAIDNLGKGAAGQAIQCANAVMGLAETTGLVASLPPVV